MERASPPVSPTVVAHTLITQNIRVTSGTLLTISLMRCSSDRQFTALVHPLFQTSSNTHEARTFGMHCKCDAVYFLGCNSARAGNLSLLAEWLLIAWLRY